MSLTAAALALAFTLQPLTASAAPPSAPPSPRPAERTSDRLVAARAAAPGHVVVKLERVSLATMRGLYRNHGIGAEDVSFGDDSVMKVKVPTGVRRDDMLRKLRSDPTVEYAEPDYFKTIAGYTAPNDPDYNDTASWESDGISYPDAMSWWLRDKGANAAAAWQHGFSATDFPVRAPGGSFKVGVIDTGFYMNHPDKGPNIVAGWDFCDSYSTSGGFNEDGDVTPAWEPDAHFRSHGTCVAGQVAASTNNGVGVASIGYDTQVRVYKVAGPWIEGSEELGVEPGEVVILNDAVNAAIYQAVDDGCKVISISLGGYESSEAEQDAVDYAHDHGVAVVSATGNDAELFEQMGHAPQVMYPARYPGVIGVGAYQLNGSGGRARASFSNHGEGTDVLAPGAMIWGLGDPSHDFGYDTADGYSWWQGTSMATPAFAGALAHLWRYQPAMTADEISDYVLRHSVDAGAAGYDTTTGWGYLDMGRVLAGYMSDYAYLAKPAVSAPSTTGAHAVGVSWSASPGRGVTYDVAVDGSHVATTSATSATVTLANGVHTVSVTPMSSYQWWDARSAASASVFVDDALPSGSFVLAGGDSYARTRTVSVDSTVMNADEMRTSTDAGSTWTAWRPYAAQLSVELPTGDGLKRVDAQYRDSGTGASISASDTIILDTVAPSGSVAIRGGAATTRSLTVSLNSSVTGASQMRPIAGTGQWVPYAATASVTLTPGVGVKAVTAEYRDAAGNVSTAGDTITALAQVQTSRVSGADRYATAVEVSKRLNPSGATTVVLASGQNYPDALCAAPLATAYGGPLLLTAGGALSTATRAELTRLRPTSVLIVGGTGVVTEAVKNAVAGLPSKPKVYRIAGADRYATAGAVSTWVKAKRGSVSRVVVANGASYTDALLAAPLAAAKGWPILLVKPTAVPAGTSSAITSLKAGGLTSALVVGNKANVSDGVAGALRVTAERVGGTTTDAYQLSAAVADYSLANAQGGSPAHIGLATGLGYADALSAGPMIAAGAGPSTRGPAFGVLLFSAYDSRYPDRVAAPVAAWLAKYRADARVSEVTAVGGTGVLTDANRAGAVANLD